MALRVDANVGAAAKDLDAEVVAVADVVPRRTTPPASLRSSR
jgi:hypothetical protein